MKTKEIPITHKLIALLDGMSIEQAQLVLQSTARALLSDQFVSAQMLEKSPSHHREDSGRED
jgi:hypothetical protein